MNTKQQLVLFVTASIQDIQSDGDKISNLFKKKQNSGSTEDDDDDAMLTFWCMFESMNTHYV